ncbi:MAG TPA: 50S ribosomal protein L17 [Geobacteraceae bacterium]
MRHNKAGRKLGRNSSHRKAMYRNMVTSLFENGKIRTTDAKAKEARQIAEKLITMGKRGDLASRRRALSYVRSTAVVAKLFDEISKQFATRPGGYTRIVKLDNRRGDNAPVSLLELVGEPAVSASVPAATTATAKKVAPKAKAETKAKKPAAAKEKAPAKAKPAAKAKKAEKAEKE